MPSIIMSMQVYARGLLQETAAVVVTSPAAAPTTARHGGSTAVNQPAAGDSPAVPAPPSTPSPYSAFDVNSHFSPIMIIILVILMSAFLFMGFFAIYVRRCAGDDTFSRRGISSRRDLQLPTFQRGCGVDPLLIESYPIVSYATAKKKGCSECVVCLTDFEGGEELKQLPKCKHVFHPGCISSWLESHTTCPLCRRSLVNSDRWSVSFRWGGSSRGASLSTRLNDGGGSRSRSRRDGETASPRTFGWAGSSRGWRLWIPGRNEKGSSQGSGQEEATPDVLDPTPSCESAPCGLPASPMSSELVTARGLPPSPLSGLSTTASIECGLRASPLSSNQVSRGCQTGIESPQSSPMSSEVATNASLLSAEVAAQRGGMTPRQLVVGRRRLSRSNSTGHSLRKGVVSKAAMQVSAGAEEEWGQTTAGCMPLSACSLNRSRSMRLDGHEEAEAAMVEPGSAMSDQSL